MTSSPLPTVPQPHPRPQDNVIRSAHLRAAGLTTHAINTRCRPSGPWQRVLPGVILLSNAPPSRRQRLRAALIYAGRQAVLTGADAIRAHGVRVPPTEEVLVLIPASRRVTSRAYVTVERTTRLPPPVLRRGLPLAPLPRATVDAARHERDRDRLRALLFAPVQEGKCTLNELRTELDAGNQRGSAAARALLTESEHVVPVSQGIAKRLLRDVPLPPPTWQTPLYTEHGVELGTADAWWPEAGLAWRLGESQQRPLPDTEQFRPILTTAGITLLHTDPARLRTAPAAVTRELVEAFSYAATNPHHRHPPRSTQPKRPKRPHPDQVTPSDSTTTTTRAQPESGPIEHLPTRHAQFEASANGSP
jgi:hypothetical protein